MTIIEDKTAIPTRDAMIAHVENPLFGELCATMDSLYAAKSTIQYSGDNILAGWNLRFTKAGRTLCTVYPRPGHFFMLVVVGRKEKERVEALLPTLSEEFRRVYTATKEGMGQRWLMLDFDGPCPAYADALQVIAIRRESR